MKTCDNKEKDDDATSTITAKCKPKDKAAWVGAAKAEKMKLTDWINYVLNKEVSN